MVEPYYCAFKVQVTTATSPIGKVSVLETVAKIIAPLLASDETWQDQRVSGVGYKGLRIHMQKAMVLVQRGTSLADFCPMCSQVCIVVCGRNLHLLECPQVCLQMHNNSSNFKFSKVRRPTPNFQGSLSSSFFPFHYVQWLFDAI